MPIALYLIIVESLIWLDKFVTIWQQEYVIAFKILTVVISEAGCAVLITFNGC